MAEPMTGSRPRAADERPALAESPGPAPAGCQASPGIALILVLLLLAILGIISAEFLYELRVQTALHHNQEAQIKALSVAQAGQSAANGLLRHVPAADDPMFNNETIQLFRYNCLSTLAQATLGLTSSQEKEQKEAAADLSTMEGCGQWSLDVPYTIQDNSLELRIEDEQARLNLNAMIKLLSGGTAEPSYTKNQFFINVVFELFRYQAFRRNLQFSDEDLRAMLDLLADYMDCCRVDGQFDEDKVTSFEYADKIIAMKNGPLDSVSEIRYLPGMTDELYNAVKDYLTVYPADPMTGNFIEGVNVNAAPVEVLYALIRGTSYNKDEATVSEEDAWKAATQMVQDAYNNTASQGQGTSANKNQTVLVPAYARPMPQVAAVNNIFSSFILPAGHIPRFYRVKSIALTPDGLQTTIIRVIRVDPNGVSTLAYREE